MHDTSGRPTGLNLEPFDEALGRYGRGTCGVSLRSLGRHRTGADNTGVGYVSHPAMRGHHSSAMIRTATGAGVTANHQPATEIVFLRARAESGVATLRDKGGICPLVYLDLSVVPVILAAVRDGSVSGSQPREAPVDIRSLGRCHWADRRRCGVPSALLDL